MFFIYSLVAKQQNAPILTVSLLYVEHFCATSKIESLEQRVLSSSRFFIQ